jgi:hypothetical protein
VVLVVKTRQAAHVPPLAVDVLQQPSQQEPLQQMFPPLQGVRLATASHTPVVLLHVWHWGQGLAAEQGAAWQVVPSQKPEQQVVAVSRVQAPPLGWQPQTVLPAASVTTVR